MIKPFDVNDAIAKNPSVDKKQFDEIHEVLRELEGLGIKSAEYNLSSPFDRNNMLTPTDTKEDVRCVYFRK